MGAEPMQEMIDKVASECVALRLRLLNRVVTNLYDDALRPLGLKVSQLNLLIVTAKLGLARPAQVCEILQLDTSSCRMSQTWVGRARPSRAVTTRMFNWLTFRPKGRRASS